MLELTATIVIILFLHYLITAFRRRRANYLRMQSTNQIEKRGRRRLSPIFMKLISKGGKP